MNSITEDPKPRDHIYFGISVKPRLCQIMRLCSRTLHARPSDARCAARGRLRLGESEIKTNYLITHECASLVRFSALHSCASWHDHTENDHTIELMPSSTSTPPGERASAGSELLLLLLLDAAAAGYRSTPGTATR